jgi:hypothetical protein
MPQSLSRLFADDTSLGYSSQNVVEIENVINHDLCELNTWSTKLLMSFNPDKTEIMLFSNTDVRYNFNFKHFQFQQHFDLKNLKKYHLPRVY